MKIRAARNGKRIEAPARVATLLATTIALTAAAQAAAAPRWSVEKAAAWAADRGNTWICGVNYIPANAINYTAMWDASSWSPDLIRNELALMTGTGLNCVRFVMQYKVYESDPGGFMRRLDEFLAICEEAGVAAMPVFFDDCAFGVNRDPVAGPQPEPLEGWYAWAWSPSPGHTMVVDPREHPKLEKFVRDVIGRHKNDPRILAWDLYNEPTNMLGARSLPLLCKTFLWARETDPSQPITSGCWNNNRELNEILLANSDIVTFHCYADAAKTAAKIDAMKKAAAGRPVICTEWMNRTVGSTIASCLRLFSESDTGCILWGLVNGKTQTHLPWNYRPEKPTYKGPWQHDLFRGDHTPYDRAEIDQLKNAVRSRNRSPAGDGENQLSRISERTAGGATSNLSGSIE